MAFDIDHKIHQHWIPFIQQFDFDSDRCIFEHQRLGREAQQRQSLRSPILPSQAGLYATSSSTTTSLNSEARLYEEHLTIGCRNIIDAAGQHSLYRPQTSYKSLTSLLTSESREGGKVPQEPL